MNWYYRTMLSYAPIFFAILSSLIFVFFTTLNSASKNKYIETNEEILQLMVQYTDANLQLIERNVVRQMNQDELLQSFYSDAPKTVYDLYHIQKSLIEFASSLPFSTSVYLYNQKTGEFLTNAQRYTQESFGDWPFLHSSFQGTEPEGWTNPRDFQASDVERRKQVVSLFKYYPYPSDKQGAVVVNVEVKSILEVLNRLNRNQQGSIILMGKDRQPFQTAMEPTKEKLLFAESTYTGWQYYSDSVDAKGYNLLSLLSNIWILFGVAVIFLAIVWFTIVTHINYKPIQTIMGKIDPYTIRRSEGLKKTTNNELKLIEGAIDRLLEKTVDYDHLHKERKQLKQRSLYYDLLTGNRTITEAEWEQQMKESGFPHSSNRLETIVFEIDRYAEFMERYSARDQYLLKYILENTFKELSEQKGLFTWHAWVHPNQISTVIHMTSDCQPDILRQICREYRGWIADHLELTVSAGIGKVVSSISQVEQSYRSASLNVSYKAVFGPDSIIDDSIVRTKSDYEKLNGYQSLLEAAHLFRMNDYQWMERLDQIFADMKQTLLTKADIANFADNLTRQLHKEIHALPAEIQARWEEAYKDRFHEISHETETLDELHDRLMSVMNELAKEIERDRLSRSNHNIAVQIKAYIDKNYADPNLSLNQVSDLFGVSPKSVSCLFKEEIGDKFMDYLLQVRFAHAKRMLLETDGPIQQIAEQVGYTHVISFHRAFKKNFDLPPGEYRNLYRS